MPTLTQSDLSDLARYPASLQLAARALWGGSLGAVAATPLARPSTPITTMLHQEHTAANPPGGPII